MSKFNAAFWKWFGDSKVVDAKGRPLVVYHGTRAAIRAFRVPAWFSNDKSLAEIYSFNNYEQRDKRSRVIPAYLSIQNPIEVGHLDLITTSKAIYAHFFNSSPPINSKGTALVWDFVNTADFMNNSVALGYDGAVATEDHPDGLLNKTVKTFCAFDPSQIKAVGNDGSWDSDDPKIRSNPRRRR